jgi:hypothetical protein
MGKKSVDTILYKETDFNDIAEECYVLTLQLIHEKEIDHLHLILEGTVRNPKEKKNKIKSFFSKKDDSVDDSEPFYHPYETVNIPIHDLDLMPYSFEALLEEVQMQNPFFGDCHSFRISIYPSKEAHRTDDYNDIWIRSDKIGDSGEDLDNLNHFKGQENTNSNCLISVDIPGAYEKEFLNLEHNLYKGAKKK